MGSELETVEEDSVVRCFCCDAWVRRVATELVNTGERMDLERWCIGCINTVDEYTRSLLRPALPPPTLDIEDLEEGN